MAAIGSARVFVLVFSSHTNQSDHVRKEVTAAFNAGIPVIPFRLENVKPEGGLGYHLSDVQWLDAFPAPIDPHIAHLVATIDAVKNGCAPPHRSARAWSSVSVFQKEWFALLMTALFAPLGLFLIWRTSYHRSGDSAVGAATGRKVAVTALGLAASVFLVTLLEKPKPSVSQFADAPSTEASAAAPPAPPASEPLPPQPIAAPQPAPPTRQELVRTYEEMVVPGGPPSTLPGAQIINTAQLYEALDARTRSGDDGFLLIDARGCLPDMSTLVGATCLSPNAIDRLQQRASLEKPVVFFCLDGGCPSSYVLGEAAVQAGYRSVFWYRGGVSAWRSAGHLTDTFSSAGATP